MHYTATVTEIFIFLILRGLQLACFNELFHLLSVKMDLTGYISAEVLRHMIIIRVACYHEYP